VRCCDPCRCLDLVNTAQLVNFPKDSGHSICPDPIRSHGQLEKAAATTAGNSPDGHGESRLEKRRPFRTASY
jgi:hypothetical protein